MPRFMTILIAGLTLSVAPAYSSSLNFVTRVVDFEGTATDDPFVGATGNGMLSYDELLVDGSGLTYLESDQFDVTMTMFDQEFTLADASPRLPPLVFFQDGILAGLRFVVAENIPPNPTVIEELGIRSIGFAPTGINVDGNGQVTLDLWVNAPLPSPEPHATTVPLPAGLPMAAGGLALLACLRKRKSSA